MLPAKGASAAPPSRRQIGSFDRDSVVATFLCSIVKELCASADFFTIRQVASAAVRGDRTDTEIAQHFGVQISRVRLWRDQLLAGIVDIFEDGRLTRCHRPPPEPEVATADDPR